MPVENKTRTAKAKAATIDEIVKEKLGVRLKRDRYGRTYNRYTYKSAIYEAPYVYTPDDALRSELIATGAFELVEIDDSYQRADAVNRPRLKSALETRRDQAGREGTVTV